MAYLLTDEEMNMSADELYELAVEVYIGEGDIYEREERHDELLRAAIKKVKGGHLRSMWALADSLSSNESGRLEAAKLYERIAKNYGDERAAYFGGYILYFKTHGSEHTLNRAMKLLTFASEKNIAEAIEIVGNHYMYFDYLDKEGHALAARLLKKAEDTRLFAFRESTMGRLYELLGEYLSEGRGTPCDPKGAFEAFEMAIRYGNTLTEHDLGECYLTGFGTQKDPQKAFECFMNTKHLYASQYRIGWCYLYGEGVDKDEIEGMKWLADAAAGGDGNAMYEYALATIEGRGVAKNEKIGISLMKEAFEEGASMSAYNYLNKLFPEDYPLD